MNTQPLLLLLAFATPMAAGADALPFPAYQAKYDVYGQGVPLGEAVITMADEGGGRYRMSSKVYPNSIVAIIIAEQLDERASGSFVRGEFRPARYVQERTGRKNETTTVEFDWEEKVLRAQHNDERATLPLDGPVSDPLSLHLLARWDLKRQKEPASYTIVDETELKTYRVRVDGRETIETGLGAVEAIRISRQRPGSSRVTTLWFAPELDHLPVQVAQEKNGSEVLRMTLASAQGVPAP